MNRLDARAGSRGTQRRRSARGPAPRPRRRRPDLRLEPLEDRMVLASYILGGL